MTNDGIWRQPQCPFCGNTDKIYTTKYVGNYYCKNCYSVFEPLEILNSRKLKIPDWNKTGRPHCIFCGSNENVYRTETADNFYCIKCDSNFELMEFPDCPKCKKNDEITVAYRGRMPWLKPAIGGLNQYFCHRCNLGYSDEALLYKELSDLGVEYDDEDSSSSYSDDIEEFDDYSGDDNPSD